MEPDEIFLAKYVPNAEGAAYHSKWKQQNPAEAAKWAAFRDACLAYEYVQGQPQPVPPSMATKYGKALSAAAEMHLSVVDLGGVWPNPEPEPPPPDPPAGGYFIADYTTAGQFRSPWSLLFSYSGDGTHELPTTQTPDGRVAVVDNPSGSGKAARVEIRDADAGWPPASHTQKSEIRTVSSQTWDKSQIAYGDERWFSTLIYLPYTATEKFEWAHGGTGTDPYTVLLENHTASSTGWSSFRMGFEAWERRGASDANVFMCFKIFGGAVHSTTNFESIPLWRLTNSDGSRYMDNHNRWIELVWGMRFSDTASGWIEAWVDDVNVFPRKARPTMWTGDFGMYLKKGLYKQKTSTFPSGASVYYYGRTTIGYSKPT